jgi:hypothetical protein
MTDPTVVIPPDGDVDLALWKAKHAYHYASPAHVSDSPFRDYFGSKDLGCRAHIPPAGPERLAADRKAEQEAQANRSKLLRGEIRETSDA